MPEHKENKRLRKKCFKMQLVRACVCVCVCVCLCVCVCVCLLFSKIRQ